MERFLQASKYIDYNSEIIQTKANELFPEKMQLMEKARIAYEFVRDEITHSFDCYPDAVTAKASDVLKYKTGICYAKSNLLAALLRSQGIPAGICYQRLTLADDDSQGYCIHAFNAVFLNGKWIKLDARGNKPGVDARFSMNEPVLAFSIRPQYDEYFYPGIYALPIPETMQVLDNAKCIQDVWDHIPDSIAETPDVKKRTFFLRTERIGFSHWKSEDVKLAEALWGDTRVTKLIYASGVFTRADILKRLGTEIHNGSEYGVQYWPIFELVTNELIGCCGLRPRREMVYEIGFHLRPEYWGRGYAKEAAKAVINYAFGVLKTEKLFAGHNPQNIASQKVLTKLGFTYIGDEYYEPIGLFHPSYELNKPTEK